MSMRLNGGQGFLVTVAGLLTFGAASWGGAAPGAEPAARVQAPGSAPGRPNVVFILADDLGYGDLGCYGQARIRTPHLDRLAAEGRRFTQCYAGSTVCAPSRCALMTGLHSGHGRVRGNALVPLQPGDVTVAETLKAAGYATGMVGKWGLGEPNSPGTPNRQGFDDWFGFLNQQHAHNYYPDFLWKNEERFPLVGNEAEGGIASKRAQYAPDVFLRETLAFLDRSGDRPFLLFVTSTLPHANNELAKRDGNGMEIPGAAPYEAEPWPQAQRNHAAMITRLDGDVGRIMAKLKELRIDDRTIVFFASDNGPLKEGGADPAFFGSSGPLRGHKRALYEGGIRVPMIVRWPGHVPAGSVSAAPWAFWDVPPTLAELAGTAGPAHLDGRSQVAALLGEGSPPPHDPFYWEFHEGGFVQAVRSGDWKGVRLAPGTPVELYNLQDDVGETRNVAASHPEVVASLTRLLDTSHVESPDFPVQPPRP